MMRFRCDSELGMFLYRSFAPAYKYQRLVPELNVPLAEQIEKISRESSDWRVTDGQLCQIMETVDTDLVKKALGEKKLEFVVCSSRERQFLDELFGIEVVFSEQPAVESEQPAVENLIQPVRLISCILAMATYGKDVLSATYCFTILCPDVLPAMRRLAESSKLNMLQALSSYVKNTTIVGSDDRDATLSANLSFLRACDLAIDHIHDAFDEYKDTKQALRAAVDIATKFLLNQKEFAGSAKVRAAGRFISSEIDQVVDNFKAIQVVVPKDLQAAPHFVTNTERMAQHLLDRMFLLAPIADLVTFSPKFRTPRPVLTRERSPLSNENVINVSTPKAAVEPQRKSFLNNNTPTPVRAPSPISTWADLIEAEKENIDPTSQIVVENEHKKDTTPIRPKPKGLRVRQASNPTGGMKAKRAAKPPSRTLHDFFK